MVAAIQLRQYREERKENARVSWAVRTQAQYIAASYMIEKGQENKALTAAEKLTLDDVEAALLGMDTEKKDPHENGVGSYERFMGMMGQFDKRGKLM